MGKTLSEVGEILLEVGKTLLEVETTLFDLRKPLGIFFKMDNFFEVVKTLGKTFQGGEKALLEMGKIFVKLLHLMQRNQEKGWRQAMETSMTHTSSS